MEEAKPLNEHSTFSVRLAASTQKHKCCPRVIIVSGLATVANKLQTATARTPIWLWPNLLSLDAPVIAVLWQGVFAHDAATKLSFAARAILPLAVWLIYLMDRLFDTAAERPMQATARHAFSRANKTLCCWLASSAAFLSAVSVLFLPLPVIRSGLAVLLVVCLYLLVVHGMGGSVRRWLPKEAAVGVIFSVGCVLAPLTWSPNPTHVLFPALLFGLLCWANSAAIEVWEGGRVDGVSALLVQRLKILAFAIALLSLTRGFADRSTPALLLSAIGYVVVEYLRPDLDADLARVAIDIPLLTPLLFLGLK
jgi:hypothetical protein